MGFLSKLLTMGEGKQLKRYQAKVDKINALEPEFQALSDEELAAKTQEFRERYAAGESLDDLLPEAFAAVREASVRTIGLRHFDVQLIGGMGLEELVGARPAHDVDVVPIVAPRARKVALRDGETHRLHQMQPRADARACACDVPRVLGNLRLHQHDVQHPCNLSFK